jgi:acetyl esterase/lipase
VAIPALLRMAHRNEADFFIIHFHANACDVGDLSSCANTESNYLNAHYLIIEYPGYGVADGFPSEYEVNRIARIVYDFVVTQLEVPSYKIVIFGRSIGTGPASKLAGDLCISKQPPAAVVLQSPFASLTFAAKDLVCNCVSTVMIDRFPNWKHICYEITCPVLILHADKDQIIDHLHSECLLAKRLANGLPCELFTQKSELGFPKTHNFYEYLPDVVLPMQKFLANIRNEENNSHIKLPFSTVQRLAQNPNYIDTDIMTDQDIILSWKWICCLPGFCVEHVIAILCFFISKLPLHSNKRDFHYPGKSQGGVSFVQSIRNKMRVLLGKENSDVDSEEMQDVENPLYITVRGDVQIADDEVSP